MKGLQVGIALDSLLAVKLTTSTPAGDAQSILLGLLSAIPSFWGTAELEQVITLYLDHSATASAPSAPMSSLMKSVAKRAPAKVILPTMTGLWPSLKISQQTVGLIYLTSVAY